MINENTEPNLILTRSLSKARKIQVKREPGTHTHTHTQSQSERKTRSAYKATSTPVKKFARETKGTPFSCVKHTPRSARPAERERQSRSVPRALGLTLVYEADAAQAISFYDDKNNKKTTHSLPVCSSPRRRLFSEDDMMAHTETVSVGVSKTVSKTVGVSKTVSVSETAVINASTGDCESETVRERETAVWSLSALLREFFDAMH